MGSAEATETSDHRVRSVNQHKQAAGRQRRRGSLYGEYTVIIKISARWLNWNIRYPFIMVNYWPVKES